jgi:hypothetical protein
LYSAERAGARELRFEDFHAVAGAVAVAGAAGIVRESR